MNKESTLSTLDDIRARCATPVTEIVANPSEYYRVQTILRDRAELLHMYDALAARLAEAILDVKKLRRMLAFAYSGERLYTDDGELQDPCRPFVIDYVRDSIDEIERKMRARGEMLLAEARAADSSADVSTGSQQP